MNTLQNVLGGKALSLNGATTLMEIQRFVLTMIYSSVHD